MFCRFWFTSILVVFLPAPATSALGQASASSRDGYENFDVRVDLDAKSSNHSLQAYRTQQLAGSRAQVVADTMQKMATARQTLLADVPQAQIELSRFGSAPEVVGVRGADRFLTPASRVSREQTAREFLAGHAELFGLTSEQVSGLVMFANYTNPAGNLSWIEFRQEMNSIPVFQGEIRAAFTAKGALARTTGNLAAALDESTLPVKPALDAAQATAFAAATIGYTSNPASLQVRGVEKAGHLTRLASGLFAEESTAELFYFPLAPGVARLAYGVILTEQSNAYYIFVDANNGTLLFRKNLAAHQSQTAAYEIYNNDSPSPLSPTGALPGSNTQPPGISRTNITLISELPAFDNLGWITDGDNTTSGNNAQAYQNFPATGSNRVFSFSYNPPPGGNDDIGGATIGPDPYRDGAIVNVFFWCNHYHDRLYQLGFTEAARNFQTTNFGRGGLGGDNVRALVHAVGQANADDFLTYPDGRSPTMRLYPYTGPTPKRDSAPDLDIVFHELTHGTSSRLHGDATGLTSRQAGGMGEGWSDFYSRCLLATADEDVNGIYPLAGYSTYLLTPGFTDNYYYGIRRFPYAVKTNTGANGKPHNPLTFADIDPAQVNLDDGAFPPSPVFASPAYSGVPADEVHMIGEVWCMMLLEMRARFIHRLGFSVGNQRALQVVTDGMKLDPADPNFVQGRDAIIAADNAGFGGEDESDIRRAFAVRGLGADASTAPATLSEYAVVESFAVDVVLGTVTFSDALGNGNGIPEPGEPLLLTVLLTNVANTIAPGVSAQAGSVVASYGDLAGHATATRVLNYTVPADISCGALLSLPITFSSANGSSTRNVELRIGTANAPIILFSQDFDSAIVPALPSSWTTTTSDPSGGWGTTSAPPIDVAQYVFVPDLERTNDSSLVSPVITLPANTSSRLTFKHQYSTDYAYFYGAYHYYDGGVLEIKISAGDFTDITAAGGSFVQGGYVERLESGYGNPLGGRKAWTGRANTTVTTVVDLPASSAGQNIQLRWRLGCDQSGSSPGWNVDSVSLTTSTFSCAAAEGVLRIVSPARNPANGIVTFSFPSVSGKTYRAEYSDSVGSAAVWNPLLSIIPGTGSNVQVSDPSAASHPQRFYRVVLLP